jgi:TonB family protein
MIAWLLISWLSASDFRPNPAWHAQTSRPTSVPPSSERRLFSTRSQEAWEVVHKRMKELGLSPDKTDRASQATLTKWQEVGAKGLEWLPAVMLEEPYVAKRIRFVVFVSPFAEPARVSIGSLIETEDRRSATSRALVYNSSTANRALMSEISTALGEDGLPIPGDRDERRKLALSVLKDRATDCLRQETPVKGAKLTPPRKITLSNFDIVYPTPAQATRTEATIRVEFQILEDGTVTGLRSLDGPIGQQLEAAVFGAVSLLLFTPAMLDECHVPTVVTNQVNYRMR